MDEGTAIAEVWVSLDGDGLLGVVLADVLEHLVRLQRAVVLCEMTKRPKETFETEWCAH